jgi:ubiquinone/menaquinone biosynthesis C-methylase UbiE
MFLSETRAFTDEIEEASLRCKKGHEWRVTEGIPTLVHPPISEEDAKWIADYDQMAENYDELVKQYDDWLGVDMMEERKKLARFVPIEGPMRIIDVSIGTAANFVGLSSMFEGKMGRFNLHGLDLSRGMLRVSRRKMKELGVSVSLVEGSVFNIPYENDFFDIVIHSGGINTFSDIPGAMKEMLRIARPEGIVSISDEGLSPKKRETEEGQAIMKANTLFAARPPLEHIPEKAKDVELTYIMNDTFYELRFRK